VIPRRRPTSRFTSISDHPTTSSGATAPTGTVTLPNESEPPGPSRRSSDEVCPSFALLQRVHDRVALVAGEEGGVLRGVDREGVERDHVGRRGLVDDVAARVV
jgi:hypothetical protein